MGNEMEALKAELAAIDAKEVKTMNDLHRKEQIEQELKKVAAEAQHKQIIEEKEALVQVAHEENAYELDNLTVEGIGSMRQMCIDEQSYELLRIAVQTLLNAKSEKFIAANAEQRIRHQEELRAADEREEQLKRQNDELQEKIESVMEENTELRQQNRKLSDDIADEMEKTDNAARQLEEAHDEIARLKDQVDDLRKEIAVGARNAVSVIDTSEQIQKAKAAFLATRIKVTNIRWEDDLRKTHYIAELAETGEQVRFGMLEKGKYLEVSEEEAARFRTEQVERANENHALAEPEESVDTFPVPEVGDVPTVEGRDTTDEGVEGEDVAEGFDAEAEIAKLKLRIDRLERQANINVA